MSRLFLIAGAISAALAVMLGAFGAHALREALTPDFKAVYQTANTYHFYHSLGLLLIAVVARYKPASAYLRWAGWSMLIGIGLFSGSLYLLSISEVRWLGAITPIGGIAFIAAWLLLALAAWQPREGEVV